MRAKARARKTDTVVEQCYEGAQKGRGFRGRVECSQEVASGGLGALDAEEEHGELEGQIHLQTPPPCACEPGEGMQLARGAAAHVHNLTWEGDTDGGIAPLERPAVLTTHALQEGRLPRILAVTYRIVPASL